ncbi:parvulin-like peptidyl-prolyl isomerase [Spiribacter salinus M19-40]|uniref:Chaperone SurA n=1 Tax=Spiribacter salinus M19-40 TaxID=1260251 RepID=R4VM41_9GAMM|nr:peptidylprolyl isomerase [Spiribacter salinus]AGM41532.1 parvulin-like peptidyl-prolyl isomerase [Spiribacter salinus M19-40]
MIRPLLASLLMTLALSVAKAEEVLLERIVALVNEDVVLASELEAELASVTAELRQRDVQIPPDDELRRQVLERLVMQTLQMNVAERRGIRVDSATLDSTVRRIADRNNLSLTGLRDALSEQGIDMARFREQMRRDIMLTRLRQEEMDERVDVTDQEIEQFLERNQDDTREYRLGQILISVPEAASAGAIDEAEDRARQVMERLSAGESFARVAAAESDARNALEGGDLGWRPATELPSVATDAIRDLEPGETTEPLRTPAGFQIYQLQETRDPDQRLIEQVNVRHILIETNEIVTDQDAQLRLESLRERLRQGASFADLARSNSDDPTTATQGGELGWLNPGSLPQGFQNALAELPIGELSQPFQTRAGWHLAEVQDRRQRDAGDQLAREEAAEAIRERKAADEVELWLRELREEAYIEIRLGNA